MFLPLFDTGFVALVDLTHRSGALLTDLGLGPQWAGLTPQGL